MRNKSVLQFKIPVLKMALLVRKWKQTLFSKMGFGKKDTKGYRAVLKRGILIIWKPFLNV